MRGPSRGVLLSPLWQGTLILDARRRHQPPSPRMRGAHGSVSDAQADVRLLAEGVIRCYFEDDFGRKRKAAWPAFERLQG